ncbi:CRISPR-associated protein Cas4 [Embleya sp. NPDC020630]|uniref:CRISPR-associated protein Cas4 n=1 Tax=Embleya sp. NPDC020630 TaxID=3363979 RepID=UPI00378C20BA
MNPPHQHRGAAVAEPVQVPISALEHHTYCPRQAGLILLEDAFADDAATVRGTILHERVHTPGHETRPGTKTLRALPLWHDTLGLTGVCDVVEIRRRTITPVEHKSGRYQPGGPGDVQVAAQAMCLEAMFDTTIDTAVVWSATDRRRHEVAVDAALRATVEATTVAVRAMLTAAALPAAPADKRCRRCSMAESCMPKVLAGDRRYRQALADLYRTPTDEPPTPT